MKLYRIKELLNEQYGPLLNADDIAELYIIESANNMMEMANLTPDETGIPYVIWVGEVDGQHGPRIKVSNIKGKMSDDCFVISVSKTPTVLTPKSCKLAQSEVADILDWVMLNYDTLMQLWQVYETGTGFSAPLLQQLQKI
jgi:hypothetical protein